jgi:hypothetical protein
MYPFSVPRRGTVGGNVILSSTAELCGVAGLPQTTLAIQPSLSIRRALDRPIGCMRRLALRSQRAREPSIFALSTPKASSQLIQERLVMNAPSTSEHDMREGFWKFSMCKSVPRTCASVRPSPSATSCSGRKRGWV